MTSIKCSVQLLALAAAGVCNMAAFAPAWAQDATFVINTREAGSPTYNPIKGTKLNIGTNLIFDRMVVQDLQTAPRRQVP